MFLCFWWNSGWPGGFQVDFWCVSGGFSCCGVCLVEFRLVFWISGGFCGSGMFLVWWNSGSSGAINPP